MRAINYTFTTLMFLLLTINIIAGPISPVNSIKSTSTNGNPGFCIDGILEGAYVLINLNHDQNVWTLPSQFPKMYLSIYLGGEMIWISDPLTTFRANGERCDDYKVYSANVKIPSEELESNYPCEEQKKILMYKVVMLEDNGVDYTDYTNEYNFWGHCGFPILYYTYGCGDDCDLIYDVDILGEYYEDITQGHGHGGNTNGGNGGGRGDGDLWDGSSRSEDIRSQKLILSNIIDDEIVLNNYLNEVRDIVVYDINGRITFKSENYIGRLTTKNWEKGFYFISYTLNKKRVVEKFVKNY